MRSSLIWRVNSFCHRRPRNLCYLGHWTGRRELHSPPLLIFQSKHFSRPGRSQGLLYKLPRDSLIKSVSLFLPQLYGAAPQTVRDNTSSYEIDYVIVIKNCLNLEGHQNSISGSKVKEILLKGWILPIGGASSGRVCACSLRSRLVFKNVSIFWARSTVILQELPLKCLLHVLGTNKIGFLFPKARGWNTCSGACSFLHATDLLATLGNNSLILSKTSGVYFQTATFMLK